MTGSASRRAVLTGLALTVHGLAPSAVLSSGTPAILLSDAELLALGDELEEAARDRRAACIRLEDAEDRFVRPDCPESLIATNFDVMGGFPRPAMPHSVRGRTWTPEQIEEIRSAPPRMGHFVPGGFMVCERTAGRKAEILAAYDAYAARVTAAEEVSGQADAETEYDRLTDACLSIAKRIAGTAASTLEGLAVKAYAYAELCGPPESKPDGTIDHGLTHSVLLDLLAFRGGTS